MKKILIILAVVILIGVIAFFVFRQTPSKSGVGGGGTIGTLPPAATGTSAYTPPAGDTITLGTSEGSVIVNNFYNNAVQTSVDHTAVLITQTSTYNITYYIPDSSFNILITAQPFDTIRAQAETAFLQMLGVSKADACKLNVKVGAPISVDPNNSGQNLGLSFCSGDAFQSQ